MSRDAALPGFHATQAALRATTERLAHELDVPCAQAPEWSEFEWSVARAVATLHGISVQLALRLRWSGPASWQDFLEQQTAHSVARARNTSALLARLDAALATAQVPAVALKGAALHALNLYSPGERPMGDVDLLIARGHDVSAEAALHTLGYRRVLEIPRHHVYAPETRAATVDFGEHAANPLKIEVHPAIAEQLPVESVDITAGLMPAAPRPGLNDYASTTQLMLHLLLHAAGNMRAHALRLVQLTDIARLAPCLDKGEWRELSRWWAWPPLALTARYFPGSIPPSALEAAATAAPGWLRQGARRWDLTTVSWSNLRIHALPGVLWSRTPSDALRFARRRFWPSRDALRDLDACVRAQPALDKARWYSLSQPQRILRWVFSRPRRVQTMMALNGARLSATRLPP